MNKLFIASITFLTSSVYAAGYDTTLTGPQKFAAGDSVTVNSDANAGFVYGVIDQTTGGEGVQVNNGGITVKVNAPTAPNVNGMSLNNGVANNLGVGTTVEVSGSRATGIRVGDSVNTPNNASFTADNLRVIATSTDIASGATTNSTASGIFIGNGGSANLSNSHITINTNNDSNSSANGEALSIMGQLTAHNLQIDGNQDGIYLSTQFDNVSAELTGTNSIKINNNSQDPYEIFGLNIDSDDGLQATFKTDKIDIDVTGNGAGGILTNGTATSTVVDLGTGSNVAVHGTTFGALDMKGGVFKANDVTLTATGNMAEGAIAAVTLNNNSSATITKGTINSEAGGVQVKGNANFTASNLTINAEDTGMFIYKGASATLSDSHIIANASPNPNHMGVTTSLTIHGQLTAHNLQVDGNEDGIYLNANDNNNASAVLTGNNSITLNQANGGRSDGEFLTGLELHSDSDNYQAKFNAEKIKIDVTGDHATGVVTYGKQATSLEVDLGTGSSVAVHGNSEAALNMKGGTFKANDIKLTADGDVVSGAAVILNDNSSATINKGTIESAADGVRVQGNANFTASNLTINAKGDGMSIAEGASATLSDSHITVNTNSDDAKAGLNISGQLTAKNLQVKSNQDGMYLNTHANAVLTGDNSITLNQTGNNAVFVTGLLLDGEGSDNYQVNFNAEKINIDVTGNLATGIGTNALTNATEIDLGTGSSVAVHGNSDAALQMDGGVFKANNIKLTADGDVVSGAAVTLDSHSSATINNGTIISDKGGVRVNNSTFTQNGGTIQAKNGFGIEVQTGGTVNLAGNTTINSSTQTALLADNGTIKTDPVGSKMTLIGNIQATNKGVIDLAMTDGSVFNGKVSTAADSTNNLNLAGNNSVWNMTDSSKVSNLTLNNSRINFTNSGYTTLTTDSLVGNGSFNMKVDIPNQLSDTINVTGQATGNHQLILNNNGSSATNGKEVITLVTVNSAAAGSTTDSTDANFSLNHTLEVGGYEYDVRTAANNPNNVELYATGGYTSTTDAAISFLNTSYLLNYIDNQNLTQRLGELRNNNTEGDTGVNMWLRSFGGKLSSFSGGQLKGFDMPYVGTQMGLDKLIELPEGNLIVGTMFGLTKGNSNYRSGKGDNKNYSLGLYATFYQESGFYLDSTLKYNQMHNQFNVTDTAGTGVKGSARTKGYSASLELGQRLWLGANKAGYYLEPQAQLTYGRQGGDTVHASNGLNVNLNSYETLLGRTSLVAGYAIEGQNPINVYVKTGYLRELSGNTAYKLNGDKKTHSFKGGWWENQLGANININKSHNIYTDLTYATGGRFDQKQINLGYRYNF